MQLLVRLASLNTFEQNLQNVVAFPLRIVAHLTEDNLDSYNLIDMRLMILLAAIEAGKFIAIL
jgi:hypothetical protein